MDQLTRRYFVNLLGRAAGAVIALFCGVHWSNTTPKSEAATNQPDFYGYGDLSLWEMRNEFNNETRWVVAFSYHDAVKLLQEYYSTKPTLNGDTWVRYKNGVTVRVEDYKKSSHAIVTTAGNHCEFFGRGVVNLTYDIKQKA